MYFSPESKDNGLFLQLNIYFIFVNWNYVFDFPVGLFKN